MIINDEFVKEYGALIYHYIRKNHVHGTEATDEIHAEVYIRLMKTSQTYDESKSKVTTWLKYQVQSVCSNYWRKKRDSPDALDGRIVYIEDMKCTS